MQVEIRDRERGEVVATASSDSGVETDDELARDTLPVGPDDEAQFLTAESPSEGVSETVAHTIRPGEAGYLFALRESLPEPFEFVGDHDLAEPDV